MAVVLVEGRVGAGDFGGVRHVVGADVAHGGDLLVGVFLGGTHQRRTAVADADETEADTVVGSEDSLVGECRERGGFGECAASRYGRFHGGDCSKQGVLAKTQRRKEDQKSCGFLSGS